MIRKLVVSSLVCLICLLGSGMTLASAEDVYVASVGQSKWWNTLQEYEKDAGKSIEKFNESPMLHTKVAAGELPSVEKRLPEEPVVVRPYEGIGRYSSKRLRMQWIGDGSGGFISQLQTFGFCRGIGRWDRTLTKVLANTPKGWKLSENGKTLTMYLRKGLKWSDGVPVTADDALFWWEDVMLNNELTPQVPEEYIIGGEPMRVEKVDDYTINFHFAVPYYTADSGFMVANPPYLVPKHWLKNYHIKYNKEAGELAKKEGYDEWWQLMGLMVGMRSWLFPGITLSEELSIGYPVLTPWIFEKRVLGGSMWKRNPYYHHVDNAGNQLPYIDTVLITRVENAEVYNLRVLAGEVDFCSWGMSLDKHPLFLQEAEKGKYRVQLAHMAMASNFSVMTNMNYNEDPILAKILHDVRFRQALSLAIDRERLNETLFFGLGTPRQDTLTPPADYYKEEWAKAYAEHNPESANRLLDEMGLDWDKDHEYRLRPDGERLKLQLTTTDEMFAYYVPAAEMITTDWKEIGVEAVINTIAEEHMYDLVSANEIQVWARAVNNTTHSGFVNFGGHWWSLKWWGPLWNLWIQTNGEKGEEPPTWVKEFEKKRRSVRYLDEEELNKTMTWLLDIMAEKLLRIGTVGMVPEPAVIANDLGNVPTSFWSASSVAGQSLLHLRIEEFFWKK